jgi:hypothetical protein
MSEHKSGVAIGLGYFAGTMMMLVGIIDILEGLAAVLKKEYFLTLPNYAFKLNITTWGWLNLVSGILILLAGVSIFGGAKWARVVGVILAALVAIENFAWLPYAPVWSVVVIALSVAVIWALTAHGRDLAD